MDYLVDVSTAWSLRYRHARERARRRLGRHGSAPRDHPVRHRRVGRAAVVRRGACQSAVRRVDDHADDPRQLPRCRIPVTLAAPLPGGWMHARPPALTGSASDHLKRGRATSHPLRCSLPAHPEWPIVNLMLLVRRRHFVVQGQRRRAPATALPAPGLATVPSGAVPFRCKLCRKSPWPAALDNARSWKPAT